MQSAEKVHWKLVNYETYGYLCSSHNNEQYLCCNFKPENTPALLVYPTIFTIASCKWPSNHWSWLRYWEEARICSFFFLHVRFFCNACFLKIKWIQFWNLYCRLPDLTPHITAKISTPFLYWHPMGYNAS